jgi:hypothetical protein
MWQEGKGQSRSNYARQFGHKKLYITFWRAWSKTQFTSRNFICTITPYILSQITYFLKQPPQSIEEYINIISNVTHYINYQLHRNM